jgi:RNA polymerase subunit RPABC4/transcription elongation factor Spt4
MELPANLNTYAAGALFFIGAYLMAIYLGLIVWTFRDIRARSRDILAQILSPLLVAIFTLPGILVYILLRPKETLSDAYERALAEEAVLQDLEDRRTCPSCQRVIREDYILCPHCQHQLREHCVNCGRLINPTWELCPYCGHNQESTDDARTEVQALPEADVTPALMPTSPVRVRN